MKKTRNEVSHSFSTVLFHEVRDSHCLTHANVRRLLAVFDEAFGCTQKVSTQQVLNWDARRVFCEALQNTF